MKIDISHIAKLANLPLSSTEKAKFEKQLGETLEYIEGLNEIETKNTEPTSQVTGLENITREDIAKPSLSQKEALSNSKSTHNGFFKAKAILTE
ncbi:MAG: Asp-tRNA(Asn)/Glu-tRNA(Gln) amidotransferase subunit GatC [Patescibacteria group bacterium]